MYSLSALRDELRTRRKQIVDTERAVKSQAATENAFAYLCRLEAVKTIGIFLSMPEEIDTAYLIERLWQENYRLYLPVVLKKNAPLVWRHYHQDSRLSQDAFGLFVPEAVVETASALDAVVMPLVGFDRSGSRIGMGGGFYDRSFTAKIAHTKPYLLGLAYACQAVEKIVRQDWDVPMDALATEAELLHFN